jgi:hypothetical protein
MKKVLFLLIAVLLAACTPAAQTEMQKNQAKWTEAKVSSYRYSLSIMCFCAFGDQMPLTVEVRNGAVASIINAQGKTLAPGDPSYEEFVRFATINDTFANLKKAYDGKPASIEVVYDAQYGFPAEISIDNIKDAVDDEVSYQINNFKVLN